MGVRRYMAMQLREPSGWFGSYVVSRVMNRVNRRIMDSTLSLLDVKPEHNVLEIGFGGGCALRLLAERLRTGTITGLDISPDMVRDAEKKFRREIARGRVRLQLGDISHIPYEARSFDRVFTINTIYFWPDPLEGMREIRRVLKPDGLAAVSLRSREKMQPHAVTKYNFRLYAPEEAAAYMEQAGYCDVRVVHRDRERIYDEVIVIGRAG